MATPEPWLRGTLTEIDPIRRAVLHALELAAEDAERWAAPLTDAQLFARPADLPSVAFQLRHTSRSLDRLLTYAEGQPLSEDQLRQLAWELDELGTAADVLTEFRDGLQRAMNRIRAVSPDIFSEPRGVGRQQLPTTVAGLLIHCAEHTQRHSGQMVTTAKLAKRA
jgi:uncharacterized damage-inducible protein DinB